MFQRAFFRLYRQLTVAELFRLHEEAFITPLQQAASDATVRDLLRAAGREAPSATSPLQANLELLCAAAPHARRLETISVTPRFDVRPRASRREAWPDAWALANAMPAQPAHVPVPQQGYAGREQMA